MKVFSFGGGVQSTAALVLAAQGRIDYRTFLFCNVGDDSENPDTLEYVRKFSRPYADMFGLELIEIRRQQRDGETLLERTKREERSVHIPVRMKNGAPGNRDCTQSFKIAVTRNWLGAGVHTVGLGISWDEIHRMRDSGHKRFVNEYPLIDLRLKRVDCLKLIHEAGLPQPPKSSCWFCPFHNQAAWHDLRLKHPVLFEQASELEALLINKRHALGKDAVYLTPKGMPLKQAIGNQLAFDNLDTCESGYCMV
jgi:hypothetical protein